MRHVSKCVAITVVADPMGESYLLVDLEGPGGAPSNIIHIAMTLNVARQLGKAGATPPADGPEEGDVEVEAMSVAIRAAQDAWFTGISERAQDLISLAEQTWLHAIMMVKVTNALRELRRLRAAPPVSEGDVGEIAEDIEDITVAINSFYSGETADRLVARLRSKPAPMVDEEALAAVIDAELRKLLENPVTIKTGATQVARALLSALPGLGVRAPGVEDKAKSVFVCAQCHRVTVREDGDMCAVCQSDEDVQGEMDRDRE